MPDIHISDEALDTLRRDMRDTAIAIGMISSGAYVTSHMFTTSQGKAVDAMNEMLDALVGSPGISHANRPRTPPDQPPTPPTPTGSDQSTPTNQPPIPRTPPR